MNEELAAARSKMLGKLLNDGDYLLAIRLVEHHYPSLIEPVAKKCVEDAMQKQEWDVAFEVASEYVPEIENNVFYEVIDSKLKKLRSSIFDFNCLMNCDDSNRRKNDDYFYGGIDLVKMIADQFFKSKYATYVPDDKKPDIHVYKEVQNLRDIRDEMTNGAYIFFEKVALAQAIEQNDPWEISKISNAIKVQAPNCLDNFDLDRYTP